MKYYLEVTVNKNEPFFGLKFSSPLSCSPDPVTNFETNCFLLETIWLLKRFVEIKFAVSELIVGFGE